MQQTLLDLLKIQINYMIFVELVEKVSSSGVTLAKGNDSIISDTLNVYVDGNIDGYAASNSLPSYDITSNIIEETLVGGTAAGLDGYSSLNERYSFINFPFLEI